jgi:hypothetical protein
LHFPKIVAGKLFQRTALIGYQRMAERHFLLEQFIAGKGLVDDEFLLSTGLWKKFVFVESTAHCISIRPVEAGASSLRIGHQCQSFATTSGAPMPYVIDGEVTTEVGIMHTRAAQISLEEDAASGQAVNEGILLSEEIISKLKRQ